MFDFLPLAKSSTLLVRSFLLCVIVGVVGSSALGAQDTGLSNAVQAKAEMQLVPAELHLTMDTSRFLIARVKVLNRGAVPLTISELHPSCSCAGANVQQNPLRPMEVGEILIRMNTVNMLDSVNLLTIAISSNSVVSPVVYSVYVHNPYAKTKDPAKPEGDGDKGKN